MPSYGPKICGTGANNGAGISWVNPTNIQANDSNYATADLGADGTTKHLRATNFNLGITAGETVVGIEVHASWVDPNELTSVSEVMLVVNGTQVGTNQSNSETLPVTEALSIGWGGATSLWGATPSVSDLNSSTSGVDITITGSGSLGNPAKVNYVTMKVYTTAAGGAAKQYMAISGVGV